MKTFIGVLFCLVAGASAMYSHGDGVVMLDSNSFNSKVVDSESLWFVEFFAPWCGHCQALVPEWKKAAKALQGVVKVGAVDADSDKSLGGQYGVRGFPSIKIFGSDKNKPEDYQGGRTAEAIVDSALSHLRTMVHERLSGKKSKSGGGGKKSGGGGGGGGGSAADVITLTDSNFEDKVMNSEEMWLVEFFAPWCGHCKNLAPHWQEAATELKGKVKVATVDATENTILASKFGVRGYPTIKYFPAGAKSDPEEYDGGRTANDIVEWANNKVAENVPAPDVHEMTQQEVLEEACNENQLCVIGILPNILDCQSECRNKYIDLMRKMGEKYKKRKWGWVWAEAGAHPDVEEIFGIGGFGYPALAALNARKMKFALMRGSFSEAGLNEFLRELAVGRGSTAPVKNAKLPEVKNIEPWDGKDGQMPEEEDYDLSDVELDDLDSKIEL